DDGAQYSVVVGNSAGSAPSDKATLKVAAVRISTQPLTQTVELGLPVRLSVAAVGTGPLTYQWKKDGSNISDATDSSYSIATSTSTDSGVYSVVVSNGAGSATSSNATLKVSRFGLVDNASGGTYALTECVKDLKTGLVWEGKPETGDRAASNVSYTNYDSTTVPQRWTGVAYALVTEAEMNAVTNTIGYAIFVNNSALCGYTDWRLPTNDEFLRSVDKPPGSDSIIDLESNPNLLLGNVGYLTRTVAPINPKQTLAFNYLQGIGVSSGRSEPGPVRLVRGAERIPPASP
ncbi:MAG: DUF1566 domain-containing protein, partial [Rhodoferax sp.]|nr:DUF1566 domain-containing protein [Rhodoferax sp.]